MASELNHHVGYSRENKCWFVRFYPYQTEQQALDAIMAFTRSAPAATDTGLETVGYVWKMKDAPWRFEEPFFRSVDQCRASDKDFDHADLCRCSQAEELLAAERAEKERLADDYQAIREQLHRGWQECCALKADNAALTARIKELEELLAKFADKGTLQALKDANDRAEALEAQAAELAAVHQRYVDANESRIDAEAALAEARKALEPFADIADLIDAETEGMAETDELVLHFHDYEFAKWPVSLFRKARAVLGGKPS